MGRWSSAVSQPSQLAPLTSTPWRAQKGVLESAAEVISFMTEWKVSKLHADNYDSEGALRSKI